MGKHSLFQRVSLPVRRLFHREHALLGRQRLALLFFCYLPVTVLGIIAIFIEVTGPTSSFFNFSHGCFLAAAAIILYLFFTRRISTATCLSAFTLIGQATLSVEMIYLSMTPTQYNLMVIVANTVLLALNTMVSMAALLERNTLVLGVATIATYIACTIISGDETLQNFTVLFVISFAIVGTVGLLVARSTHNMEEENRQLKKGEAELLTLLRMRKDEVKAFLSLAKKKYDNDGTKLLMESLDKKTRYNLLTNVEEYIRERDTDLSIIEKAFPELTPSEREICRLVLQGKKLGEICTILGKTETNINSQRANVRRKLGLQPSDNLQRRLQERLGRSVI